MLKNKLNIILLIISAILIFSCTKKIEKKSIIQEKSIDLQILETYKEAINELEAGDAIFAAKKFNEVEILFPQSEWAPKSTLMAAYAYYAQDYYFDTIEELKIFLKKYPNHKDVDYAYYLMGMAYYEQIVDEKKDLNSILMAKKQFEKVVNDFPETDYALDAKFKLDLIADLLAAKEMYLGRYYFEKKKWIPAINRFNNIVKKYDKTIYVEEALHRLVEVYYTIGLIDEAKKYANLLGYNYQSSEWYEMSYSVFDKKYKDNKKETQNNKNNIIIKKFKSLFE
jgi:outer membrane protein assembly factor BamD